MANEADETGVPGALVIREVGAQRWENKKLSRRRKHLPSNSRVQSHDEGQDTNVPSSWGKKNKNKKTTHSSKHKGMRKHLVSSCLPPRRGLPLPPQEAVEIEASNF